LGTFWVHCVYLPKAKFFMKEYNVTLVLDKRREKTNGLYPVRLRVYSVITKQGKRYPTKFAVTERDFESIWETTKTRTGFKEIKLQFKALEMEANKVCEKIKSFSFEQFEKKFFRYKGDGLNIIYQYDLIIKGLQASNNLGTASTYELALKSIINFDAAMKGRISTKIIFNEITSDWLDGYESYMIGTLKRSPTTVSIYLRTLRTIFNNAIREREIDKEIYPFGKGKYQPHNVSNVKKALSKEELKKLFEAEPDTVEQAKAKDFWFFSYTCNGMNIKDIALLTFDNMKGETLEFYRAKTIHTSKADLRPVSVYLTDYAQYIIKKYANKKVYKEDYIFSILSKNDSELMKFNKIKNFTKFINQNLKKLALKKGITEDISTYWARHSFATNAVRSGASMEFVSEALSHNNLKTTQAYFAGFEEESKKEIMDKLMIF
jgi:integrase/recombinase XerD